MYWESLIEATIVNKVYPKSRTTFDSPFGKYSFQRILFGLVMSQEVFQQKVDLILEKCPGTLGLLDDVIVYGKTKEDHERNLQNLLKIVQIEGLMFNSDKYTVGQKQKHFLGPYMTKTEYAMTPRRWRKSMLPSPKSITDLTKVKGIIIYVTTFISHHSDLRSPMKNQFLKMWVQVDWKSSKIPLNNQRPDLQRNVVDVPWS